MISTSNREAPPESPSYDKRGKGSYGIPMAKEEA